MNRVQAELDSLNGQLAAMEKQIVLSPLDVTLKKKVRLGPLGWVAEGMSWVIKKLFVWD